MGAGLETIERGAVPTAGGAPTAAEPPPPEEESGDAEEAIAPAALSGLDEPWIDTPLCTSCNDCLNLNPRLFLYNEDKQVQLGDRDAGTYAQMVEAAELCPAGCIHPGRPWDPDEPGLDELIERAAPFNQ
jgi:ferredoxin